MLSRPLLPYMVSGLFVPRHRPPSQLTVRARATPLTRSSATANAKSKSTDLFTLQPPSPRGTSISSGNESSIAVRRRATRAALHLAVGAPGYFNVRRHVDDALSGRTRRRDDRDRGRRKRHR